MAMMSPIGLDDVWHLQLFSRNPISLPLLWPPLRLNQGIHGNSPRPIILPQGFYVSRCGIVVPVAEGLLGVEIQELAVQHVVIHRSIIPIGCVCQHLALLLGVEVSPFTPDTS